MRFSGEERKLLLGMLSEELEGEELWLRRLEAELQDSQDALESERRSVDLQREKVAAMRALKARLEGEDD